MSWQDCAEQTTNSPLETGKIRGPTFFDRSDPPDPEMRSPATAATGRGKFAPKIYQTERREYYSNRLPAAMRYTISADLLVLSFALVDRVLS